MDPLSTHLYKAIRADGTAYYFHHFSLEQARVFASDAVEVIDCNA